MICYVKVGYDIKLQYPVRIKTPNAKTAKYIISQLGGPDGELAASLRYMNQRYSMKLDKVKGVLTDISTEESARRWCTLLFQNKIDIRQCCLLCTVLPFFICACIQSFPYRVK